MFTLAPVTLLLLARMKQDGVAVAEYRMTEVVVYLTGSAVQIWMTSTVVFMTLAARGSPTSAVLCPGVCRRVLSISDMTLTISLFPARRELPPLVRPIY